MHRRGFFGGALAALLGVLGLPRRAKAGPGLKSGLAKVELKPGVVMCFHITGPKRAIGYCRVVSLDYPGRPGSLRVKFLGTDYQDGNRVRYTWEGKEGARKTHPFPRSRLIPVGGLPAGWWETPAA